MKKVVGIVLLLALLSGCGTKETAETIADEWIVPVMAQPKEIAVDIPGDAVNCGSDSMQSQIYIADGYEIEVQTLDSGDLGQTVKQLTGFNKEDLTIIQTKENEVKRYEFVWASAGESADRLGHGIILDDGNYHYCLSVLRDADYPEDSQIVWSQIFETFRLV